MKATEILTVLTLILLVCSLVACNDAGKDKTNDGDRKKEIASLMAMEPKSMEEATQAAPGSDGAGNGDPVR